MLVSQMALDASRPPVERGSGSQRSTVLESTSLAYRQAKSRWIFRSRQTQGRLEKRAAQQLRIHGRRPSKSAFRLSMETHGELIAAL